MIARRIKHYQALSPGPGWGDLWPVWPDLRIGAVLDGRARGGGRRREGRWGVSGVWSGMVGAAAWIGLRWGVVRRSKGALGRYNDLRLGLCIGMPSPGNFGTHHFGPTSVAQTRNCPVEAWPIPEMAHSEYGPVQEELRLF